MHGQASWTPEGGWATIRAAPAAGLSSSEGAGVDAMAATESRGGLGLDAGTNAPDDLV